VIRPAASGGVVTQLQAALEVNDEQDFEAPHARSFP
jgi:hypothetical protein